MINRFNFFSSKKRREIQTPTGSTEMTDSDDVWNGYE